MYSMFEKIYTFFIFFFHNLNIMSIEPNRPFLSVKFHMKIIVNSILLCETVLIFYIFPDACNMIYLKINKSCRVSIW